MTGITRDDVLRYTLRRLNSMKERGEEVIVKHTDQIRQAPAYAMEWADKLYIAAAEAEFATGWLAFFENDKIEGDKLDIMAKELNKSILNQARSISNTSTSVSSNYMKQCRLEVLARFYDDLKLELI